ITCDAPYYLLAFSLSFSPSPAHRDLHSFPTRRSSDLGQRVADERHDGDFRKRGANLLAFDRIIVHVGGGRTISPRRQRAIVLPRSEEHTSELQSPYDLVCRLLLEKKKKK